MPCYVYITHSSQEQVQEREAEREESSKVSQALEEAVKTLTEYEETILNLQAQVIHSCSMMVAGVKPCGEARAFISIVDLHSPFVQFSFHLLRCCFTFSFPHLHNIF